MALSFLIHFAHLVCPVKSALPSVYPMPGAVDLSDGRDPPIPLFQCVVSSPEVEFFLFNRAHFLPSDPSGLYGIESIWCYIELAKTG